MNYQDLLSTVSTLHTAALQGASRAVNRLHVLRNWAIGCVIFEFEQNGSDRAEYGEGMLKNLTADLAVRSVTGLGLSTLKGCRTFYRMYPQIGQSVIGQFGSLLEKPTTPKGQSPIGLFQPAAVQALATEAHHPPLLPATIANLIRDPYILEFTGLAEKPHYLEKDLEKALLDHLQSFLLELGTGFSFEARQRRVTVGNEHDYIDLVFYHRILRCHLLIDLKTRAFQHGDAGQRNFYLNFWKAEMMAEGDQSPVGLILCSDKKETRVDYATGGLDQQIFVSRYLVALPKPEEIQRLIETDLAVWEQNHPTEE